LLHGDRGQLAGPSRLDPRDRDSGVHRGEV